MQCPQEILDAIVHHVGMVGLWGYLDDSRRYQLQPNDCRQTLANMRLVNKAFCKSSSPRLFQHVVAKYSGNPRSPPLERLRQLSASPYASYVQHIDLGLDCHYYSKDSDSDVLLFAEDMAGLLSPCLSSLPNLGSLDFICSHRPEAPVPPRIRTLLIDSLASALSYVNMPNLKELNITCPLAYHFSRLSQSEISPSRIPMETVIGRLRHLGLKLDAWTTQQAQQCQRYWVKPVYPADINFPNEMFAAPFFKLMEAAVNVDSLSICCTNILNLDQVSFPSPLRLKTLFLSSVALSTNTLLNLIRESRDSIRDVQLYSVQLNNGTWQDVLVKIARLHPRGLIEFYLHSCGYSLTGTSSELISGLLPPPDDPEPIETSNYSDWTALRYLQHGVAEKRTMLGLPEVYEYTKAHDITSEDLSRVMEELGITE